jgi:leader peptidase (prepilin peptidase)/N-methyltransferase
MRRGEIVIAFAALMALLGAAVGSFVALVAERLVRGDRIALARSTCRSCGTVLRARDLVPVFSFLALRGRCAACNARIPPLLFQAEILGAAFGVAAAYSAPDPLRALLLAAWLWTLLGLALADLRYFRLPDGLTLAAAVLGLALALAGDGSGWPPLADRAVHAMIGAVAGGGSFWLIRVGYRWQTGRDGMGWGDVKLMAALGLAMGLERLPIMVLLAALSALLMALLRAWRKGRPLNRLGRVPFGAALAMAAAVIALI